MTLLRFIAGIPLAAITIGPLVLGAGAARRRLMPGWQEAEAVLVDLVMVLAAITVISEVLGTFGWFSLWPLTLTCVAAGGITWLIWRDPTPHPAHPGLPAVDPPTVGRPWWTPATVGAVLVVAGSWLSRTIVSLDRGMISPDTLWYHLPIAARFVQSGSTTATPILDGDSVTAYFPATSSIWHGIGLLLFDTDLVSTVVSLGWLAVALLAAWHIGRRFGVAPLATLATAIVFSLPGVVETQAGSALTDAPGLALLLIAVVLLLRLTDEPDRFPGVAGWVPLGLCLGLLTGMKFTFIFPAGALALTAVFTSRAGARARRLVTVVAAALASGAYWYLRNWQATGNPLPSLGVHLGPLTLDAIPGTLPSSTVASLLFDGAVWKEHFIPGFRDAFGAAWPVVLLLSFAGMTVAIGQRSDRRLRCLGLVAVASTVAYLFTPQYLFGGMFFATNLRYGLPALLLGLVLLPLALPRRAPLPALVFGSLLAVLAVTQADHVNWSTGLGSGSFFGPVGRKPALWAMAAVVVVAAALLAARSRPVSASMRKVAPLLVSLVVLAGLVGVHNHYVEHRYVDAPPFPAASNWVRGVRNSDIGVFGSYLSAKYPFYGPDRSNRVQYLSIRENDGRVRSPATCQEWIGLLRAGGYRYVAINTPDPTNGPVAWTGSVPGARRVVDAGSGAFIIDVFELPDPLPREAC